MCACLRVNECVCVCVCACVRAACARVRACARVSACVRVCVCARARAKSHAVLELRDVYETDCDLSYLSN